MMDLVQEIFKIFFEGQVGLQYVLIEIFKNNAFTPDIKKKSAQGVVDDGIGMDGNKQPSGLFMAEIHVTESII